MRQSISIVLLSVPFLFSCASKDLPYKPAAGPERAVYPSANLYVYPDDVRTNLVSFTNTPVAWAGVITQTDFDECPTNDYIRAVTTLDHHYYDWKEDSIPCRKEFGVSPRGEGPFQITWFLRRTTPQTSIADARKYAPVGKMALVYGIPLRTNGDVVVLDYTYLRILNDKSVKTNKYDYGRAVNW